MTNPLFIGVYPGGIVYADRTRERDGDYARAGFLPYDTLALDIEQDCPAAMVERIKRHAGTLQARRGEPFQLSASGNSTVILGSLA